MAFGIILILIVVGSVLFHFLSPWQQTPLASNWGTIDDTLAITLVITGIFFVAIILFMAYALIRFRHRDDGRRAAYEPENKKLEWWLIVLTSIGICGMLAPGLIVYGHFVNVPEEADVFEAVGQQWQWTFRFPGKDGVMGTADVEYMNFDNPFGLNPGDPNGQDDVLVQNNELHLPLDRPVKALLRSKDVLHDFYVPQFRVKMDLVPGLVSYLWFTPTKTGTYEILCAEYCGTGHYNMRGLVTVDEPADYQQWLDEQPTFAQTLSKGSAKGLVEQGQQIAQGQGCFACHSIDGSKSLGPGWQGLYGKTETLDDGSTVTVDDEYIKESIVSPSAKMVQGYPPVMVPYPLSDEQLQALIAYTKSLSGEPGAKADAGGAANEEEAGHGDGAALDLSAEGQKIAQQYGCFACHSLDGKRGVGPSWKGLYGKTETLADGSTVLVDDDYIRESITDPNAKLVKGFPAVMQAYPFDEQQLSALIAFTKTGSEKE